MRHGSGFVAMFIGDSHFIVPATSFQCRENRGISKVVVAFLHLRFGIGVPDGYPIELAVVHANWNVLSFLDAIMMGAAYSARAGSITSTAHILSFLCVSSSRARVPARYGAEWIGRSHAESNLISCLTAFITPKCSSYMCGDLDSIFKYFARYAL